MGCDIHLYVEYRTSPQSVWRSLGGCFRLSRSYRLFGLLAGVRGGKAVFLPRGMPADAGHSAAEDDRLLVVDMATGAPPPDTVARDVAEQWVETRVSRWVGGGQAFVTHPDWHSHSFLTLQEFQNVAQVFFAESGEPLPSEYRAVLAMMKAIEEGGHESRVIFWFDN